MLEPSPKPPVETAAATADEVSRAWTPARAVRGSPETPVQKLLVYQSLWAMERRRPDGHEWPLDEKLRMIADAGFDGAGVRFADREFATR